MSTGGVPGVRAPVRPAGDYQHRLRSSGLLPVQDAVEKAFGELLAHTPPAARVFACGDSAGVRAVARVHDRITTYGFGTSNAVRVRVAEAAEAGSRFSVTGGPDGEVALRVTLPGLHNVLNATAAFLAARQMGPATAPLAAWLEAHGLTYGIAGYWDASIVTLQSGNRVQIRAVDLYPGRTSTRPTGRRTRCGTTPPGTTQRSRSPTPTAVTRRSTSSTSSASQRRPTG